MIEKFLGTKPTFQPSQMKVQMKDVMKNGDDILKPPKKKNKLTSMKTMDLKIEIGYENLSGQGDFHDANIDDT
jgi:hypothetical protein